MKVKILGIRPESYDFTEKKTGRHVVSQGQRFYWVSLDPDDAMTGFATGDVYLSTSKMQRSPRIPAVGDEVIMIYDRYGHAEGFASCFASKN